MLIFCPLPASFALRAQVGEDARPTKGTPLSLSGAGVLARLEKKRFFALIFKAGKMPTPPCFLMGRRAWLAAAFLLFFILGRFPAHSGHRRPLRGAFPDGGNGSHPRPVAAGDRRWSGRAAGPVPAR